MRTPFNADFIPAEIISPLRGKLVVSCQASPGEPLDDLHTLSRMAAAVLLGGAAGLRAEGAERVAAFRALTPLPIIGLTKTLDSRSDVYITPSFLSAAAIAHAGADIIALDCTHRRLSESEPWPKLIRRIHGELKCLVCADIATMDDALAAEAAGADVVATTLRGYTAETAGIRAVDWPMLETLVDTLTVPVILEGHVQHPEEVTRALRLGVHAVVVGSAITRPQVITARFVSATELSPDR